MDIVHYSDGFPALVAWAERADVSSLIVLGAPIKQLRTLQKGTSVKLFGGKFVMASDIARLSSQKTSSLIFAQASRASLEHPAVAAVVDAEIQEKRDKLHQRNSGLNEVLASIASQNKKVLLLNLSLLRLQKKEQVLGRFLQNIALAKKAKLPVLLISGARTAFELRATRELRALTLSLGIPSELSRQAEKLLLEMAEHGESLGKDAL